MNVPAFNLSRVAESLADEIGRRWRDLATRAAFIGGAEVEAFETAFAAYLGSAGAVGVANGTDSLVVAMRALDLKPGDEVIVPAFTFIATASSVALAGGVPVFADVLPDTLNLDPREVEALVTPRTVGVIGVHLFGRPFDVEAIGAVCSKHGLWLIEDAAQSQGAAVGERKAGNFGALTSWSFYPTKNLGAFGDAGAVTGNDLELLARVRRIANHGRAEHYFHSELGVNSRLDALQAAVLNVRLPRLDEGNRRRREIACRYHGFLAGAAGVELPVDRPGATSVYHQYTLLSDRRDELKAHLAACGVGSGVYYPLGLHQQPALTAHTRGRERPLAVTEAACGRALSLPMFPELTADEVDAVGASLGSFFGP